MNAKNNVRLGLEQLEDRRVMAGNVTVSLVNGEARVVGDNLGNKIEIFEVSAGKYRVNGYFSNGANTTVNGQASATITTNQDDLRVFMNGGNDLVAIGNATNNPFGTMTVEDLEVDMGSGADDLVLGNLRVYDTTDTCFLRMGTESQADVDRVAMNQVTFRAGVSLTTGGGADQVELSNVSVRTRLTVDTGAATDRVTLSRVTADEIYANLGAGNNDNVLVSKCTVRRLVIDGGPGTGDFVKWNITGNNITSKSIINC